MTELRIECCDPRDRAGEIQELFSRNGQPAFDAVFKRMYIPRAKLGLRSWVGVIDGRVSMHISVSPMPFCDGNQTRMGGVTSDLMVDETHRDFWAPLKLLRTLMADLKREGRMEFLWTTANKAAEGLFRAGGFKPFDRLRRFVLPLLAPYVSLARLRSGAARRTATSIPLSEQDVSNLLPCLRSPGTWRPLASPDFYGTRIPRHEYADATWVRVDSKKGDGAVGWALLCRHREWPEIGLADAFWNESEAGFFDVVSAAARWGRANRFPKLSVSTLERSRIARHLHRAGFFARSYGPVVLLHQVGASPPAPPPEDWFLTGLAGTTW